MTKGMLVDLGSTLQVETTKLSLLFPEKWGLNYNWLINHSVSLNKAGNFSPYF